MDFRDFTSNMEFRLGWHDGNDVSFTDGLGLEVRGFLARCSLLASNE